VDAKAFATFIASLVILVSAAGCNRNSSAMPLDLQTLHQLNPTNTSKILYKEVGGDIMVTVIDKHGDAHIHRLSFEGSTRSEALELLRQKGAVPEAPHGE
jgi:hypothetical protein